MNGSGSRTGQRVLRAGTRILIYSHDSFGLGHLRRCLAIARALVEARADLSVLILSGSPIIGSFDFPDRIDFVRVPGVIKLSDGDYRSLKLDLALEETLALRGSILEHTAETFDPDLFLVDKEPLGLRGEIRHTLEMLRDRGVPCILGLRDVMDDPELLRPEWERKQAIPVLDDLYDEIWVYGVENIWQPLAGLPVPASVIDKMVYTGYLRRGLPDVTETDFVNPFGDERYFLVTGGGGGDSIELVEWVLAAYETDAAIPLPAILNLGPFMPSEVAAAFHERAAKLDNVACLTFHTHIETLLDTAAGVVAMGGYNTFCEILSFDKPALLVPRTTPRREQLIRAERAETLGFARLLRNGGAHPPEVMAGALRDLVGQSPPSKVLVPGLLDGLEGIISRVDAILGDAAAERRALP